MAPFDRAKTDHVRWSFADLLGSPTEGYHHGDTNRDIHRGQEDDDATSTTLPVSESEATSTKGSRSQTEALFGSESMSTTSSAESHGSPLECTIEPIIDSEFVPCHSQVDFDGERGPTNIVMMNGAKTAGHPLGCSLEATATTTQPLNDHGVVFGCVPPITGIEDNHDEIMSEATRMSQSKGSSDSMVRSKPSHGKTTRKDGDVVNVFDIDLPVMSRWSKEGVASMEDVSSTTSSFQNMSISSFGGSSNERSNDGSSLSTNTLQSSTGTPSSGEFSSSNGSTLTSSQEGSGLTATSKKQSRIRGAGPLSSVTEDELATEGLVEGKEVTFGEDDMADPMDGSVAVKEDDTFSTLSGLTGIMVQSVDGDGLRTVTEMEMCDKEGRPGKYTGTVSGSGIVAPSIPYGKGKMVYDSGIVYEGGWKHGTWEDYGKLTFAENGLYAGEFARGIFWGRGLRNWPDGSHYEGEWVLGKRSGNGSFHSCRGDETEGTWVEDKVEGKGRVTFANGSHYEGMFVGGVQEGECKYRDVYGKEHEGVWVSQRNWRMGQATTVFVLRRSHMVLASHCMGTETSTKESIAMAQSMVGVG